MAYNLSFMDTNNTLADVFGSVNEAAGGAPLLFILITIFFISYASFITRHSVDDTIIMSGFFTTVVAAIFMFLGWVNWLFILPSLILIVVAIIYKFTR